MSRYIKESEIQEVIDKWQESLSPRTDLRDSVIFDTLESVNFHIDDLAIADVVEVVHGHWIDAYPEIEPNPMFAYGICSICGCKQSISNKLQYCMDCGAKMDGKKVE